MEGREQTHEQAEQALDQESQEQTHEQAQEREAREEQEKEDALFEATEVLFEAARDGNLKAVEDVVTANPGQH